ncbi:haloacid dehalogenase-like hydrolase [Carboxylicivirga sediminis]|uniref:phosphoserine phosphatase n=1 Tax=Carboxylicivirga sediminis TaxID=2006564 RepID=A0A941J0Y9_9BACT|nr:HAD family hydrolase [Carboxylicivirga sediminis]MBR8538304.1 haloacid dehalogenase-like hydrolase [Carboxylicivirga sediminis]
MRISLFLFSLTFLLACNNSANHNYNTSKALPSWSNTPVKEQVLSFVEKVSEPSSIDYVPVEDRIAVFDNDGTLWNEKPLYIPLEYEINNIQTKVAGDTSLLSNELYKGLAEGNLAIMKDYNTFELITQLFALHDGQDEAKYRESVHRFLSYNHHSKFERPFKEMVFKPMVELVHYLQKHQFKVYIVTGGEITFVRTVSQEIYNIPVENVIGSSVKLNYISDDQGIRLVRTGTIQSANDKQVKPSNIELHIGKKPIFAAGNSDGDYEMMEYTLSGNGPSMAILVHHDDAVREYSYMHGTEKAIEDANSKGWHVVSMKNDFKEIFPN